MSDRELLRRPVTVSDVLRRASGVEARGAVGALVATIATVNDVLEHLESSTEMHMTRHGQVLAAVSAALADAPNAGMNGLALGRVDGKERLLVNPEALAAALAKDPAAVNALVKGDHRLTEVLTAALATTDEDVSSGEVPGAPAERPADTIESARLLTQIRTLQRLDELPSTARHRLELLV